MKKRCAACDQALADQAKGLPLDYIYDLHSHSHCSDGQLSPEQLVALAIEQGVGALALTDHDTVAGVAAAKAAAQGNIDIVPGIEFSAQWQGQNIHIVGLQVDIDSPALQGAVAQQREAREARARLIGERLAKAGIDQALAGARAYASGDSLGRPHFAQYLVEAGHVANFAQAFKRYLGAGKIGDVKQHWPVIEVVVQWITAAGGVAVLAHPDKYKLTRTKLYRLLEVFVAAGGRAMELVSGQQTPDVTQKLLRASQDFSLLASCGSDFHTTEHAWQLPGAMSPLPRECRPVWHEWV